MTMTANKTRVTSSLPSTKTLGRYRVELMPNGLYEVYDYACKWSTIYNGDGTYRFGGAGDHAEPRAALRAFMAKGKPVAVPTYDEFCRAMRSRQPVKVLGMNNREVTGVVNGIQAEDGSGNCFNVTLQTTGGVVVVFVRVG